MEFTFGQYLLDIDVEKTRAVYETLVPIGQDCGCPGCRNYEKAAQSFPQPLAAFFQTLGIDPRKTPEIYVNNTRPDGLLAYQGFFHLCGRILRGDGPWVGEDIRHWDPTRTWAVTEHFSVGFQEEVALLEEGFPMPVIQLEVEANLPWVLDEPNPYP